MRPHDGAQITSESASGAAAKQEKQEMRPHNEAQIACKSASGAAAKQEKQEMQPHDGAQTNSEAAVGAAAKQETKRCGCTIEANRSINHDRHREKTGGQK